MFIYILIVGIKKHLLYFWFVNIEALLICRALNIKNEVYQIQRIVLLLFT